MVRFSRRTRWDLSGNPLSLALEKLRDDGTPVIDLTESNPTRAGFDYPAEIFLAPLSGKKNLTYAPDPQGLLSARQAVSAYYSGKGLDVLPQRLTLTSSTSEGYSFLFRLLFEPGDRVLVPAPSYPLFSYLAGLNDVEAERYRLRLLDGRWEINMESVEQALSARTRAVILVSPNNPTGSCVRPRELDALNALAEAHGFALIADEVFADYLFDRSSAFFSLAANDVVPTFVLGGVSKALALPQMKLSWIATNGPQAWREEALARLEVMADTFLSVNTPAQNAAAAWFQRLPVIRDQVLARVQANYATLQRFTAQVRAGAAEGLPAEGGWYAVLKLSLPLPEDEWALRLLQNEHVYIHPGFFFDFPEEGHVVLSLLPDPGVFQEGVRRLLRSAVA